ncbi:MAG: PadR family transcriptional regulator [Anaerolineaceae bacterium]|nr:PadR family transcriptional regulator [Anaerolineaceae bacterium]
MTIRYALLGFLSWRPFSGYDLKKMIAHSSAFYWSGNNNQIYRTLIQLHQEGLVSQEIQLQDSLPAKKLYSITDAGQEALHAWALATPELPEQHNSFLVQLAWAAALDDAELDGLLERYAGELQARLLMLQEGARRQAPGPRRSRRETFLWDAIERNVAAVYTHELEWVQGLRQALRQGEY